VRVPRVLSENEIVRMFSVAEGRDLMILKCLFYLGLSNRELRYLKTEDFDLAGGRVKVGKAGRNAIIPSGLDQELGKWVGEKKGLLFPGRSQGKISDRHIRRIVKKYAALGKVRNPEEIHPYTLKHSHKEHI